MARLRKSRKFIGGVCPPVSPPAPEPQVFYLEPAQLFPTPAPLEVEIGSGKGDFVLERARQLPQRNFLAVELAGSVFQWLAIRVARSGLNNLRALRADARPVINLMLPAESVRAFHVYFPDPWPKSRHSKHRLFTPSLVGGLARCLERGGQIHVATDVEWYFGHIAALFAEQGFGFGQKTVSGAQRTNFGRRFLLEGKTIYGACFQPPGEPVAAARTLSRIAADA